MDLSKKAQTLIASCILVTIFVIYPNINQSQVAAANANNKFGIHIISPVPQEASDAASLVNSSGGDWGYVTFLIQSNDRNRDKWQEFFNELRRRHLIPIVRLATKPVNPDSIGVNAHWERPDEADAQKWADFLSSLNWPVKNRYIVIYNEPNHGQEWENIADPKSYAQVLSATIDTLKQKSADFFVLNAGFDQATPHQPPLYFDQMKFLEEMDQVVPGIFNKLDGWTSHSYPNPAFAGSPNASGRGSVRGFLWEMQVLRRLGLKKTLPVFITETGWKRSNTISSEVVGQFLQTAFLNAWSSNQIMAVTPFLLNYEDPPFEDFAFKNYPQYHIMANIPKQQGQPLQANKAELVKGDIYRSIVAGQQYNIKLEFKNSGQSIWDQDTKLVVLQGKENLGIKDMTVQGQVEPEQKYTFNLKIKAPHTGKYQVVLNLVNKDKLFDSAPLEFTSEVKTPVILAVKSGKSWKRDHSGDYFLETKGIRGTSVHSVNLNRNGLSQSLEAPFLLPDYEFEFTLSRPNYKPKTIHYTLSSGVNVLDFEKLEPDILGTLLNPRQLWQLLPF